MTSINMSFLVSLIIIVLGYFSKKVGLLKKTDGEAISRIIFNFTLPAVVLSAFSKMKIDYSLLLLPFINIVFGLFMTGLAFFLFRNVEYKDKGMSIMLISGFNIGLFAYPIVEMLWGIDGLKHFGMFDIGNAFIVFGTNYLFANIYSSNSYTKKIDYKKVIGRVFKSIPFLSYIIALIIAITHFSLPNIFNDLINIIAKANMPLSLILLGVFLSFNFDKEKIMKMTRLLFIRYSIGICIGVLLYIILPFGELFKIALLIGLSLPISVAVIPYSVEFGYDRKFVGTINTLTILISFVLMWIFTFLLR